MVKLTWDDWVLYKRPTGSTGCFPENSVVSYRL